MTEDRNTSNRSFGSMDEQKRRENTFKGKGGQNSRQKENAHEFSSPEEGIETGRRSEPKQPNERGGNQNYENEEEIEIEAGR